MLICEGSLRSRDDAAQPQPAVGQAFRNLIFPIYKPSQAILFRGMESFYAVFHRFCCHSF